MVKGGLIDVVSRSVGARNRVVWSLVVIVECRGVVSIILVVEVKEVVWDSCVVE